MFPSYNNSSSPYSKPSNYSTARSFGQNQPASPTYASTLKDKPPAPPNPMPTEPPLSGVQRPSKFSMTPTRPSSNQGIIILFAVSIKYCAAHH